MGVVFGNPQNGGPKLSGGLVQGRGDTALKSVRAEQVRRPERKQNWTVPHCGSVFAYMPKPLTCRPYTIHIIIETVWIIIILTKPRAAIR